MFSTVMRFLCNDSCNVYYFCCRNLSTLLGKLGTSTKKLVQDHHAGIEALKECMICWKKMPR